MSVNKSGYTLIDVFLSLNFCQIVVWESITLHRNAISFRFLLEMTLINLVVSYWHACNSEQVYVYCVTHSMLLWHGWSSTDALSFCLLTSGQSFWIWKQELLQLRRHRMEKLFFFHFLLFEMFPWIMFPLHNSPVVLVLLAFSFVLECFFSFLRIYLTANTKLVDYMLRNTSSNICGKQRTRLLYHGPWINWHWLRHPIGSECPFLLDIAELVSSIDSEWP